MALKRKRASSPTSESTIFRSSRIEDQKSFFIAAFSSTLPANALQKLPEFKTATHKIAAWRKRSRQLSLMPESKVLYDLGYDDDGERWAGGRLSNVLKDTEVEGVVVVARWYGGQNIGPNRFTHIESCAREAIWNWKVAHLAAQKEQVTKKQIVEDEEKQKEFIKDLRERDHNIMVLRKLLAEKQAKLNDEEPAPPTPQKPPAYETMSLEALRRIDKARDATVAFILKQIDKVDEELSLVDILEKSTQDSFENGTQDSWKDALEEVPDEDQAPSTPK